MASAWIAGVFGAIGALVGAGATLAASWIPTRSQRQLAADNREERKAKVRRAASAKYLVTVDSFIDSARELVYRIENEASEPDREAAHASARKLTIMGFVQLVIVSDTVPVSVCSPPDELQAFKRVPSDDTLTRRTWAPLYFPETTCPTVVVTSLPATSAEVLVQLY